MARLFRSAWGLVSGSLSAQADLSAALASKEATGTAASAISTHEAASNPHPTYLTAAEGDAAYDAIGAATAAVATHAGLSDPHTGYQKESEKGNANGYASLDGDGLVPAEQLPGGGSLTIEDVIDALYPVGSLYTSTLSTNPGTLLGRGTWAAFGAGRVMVGHDSGDADFDTGEETGGSKTATSTGTVSQPTFAGDADSLTHAGTAVANHAAHTHDVTTNVAVGDHAAHTHSVTSNVTVADHAAHTHSVTSNVAVGDHASHTHTYTEVPNHLHTLATGTGASGNFSQVIGTVDATSGGTGGTPTQTALGTLSGNPVGGVASGTTAGPSATLSHSVTNNAVTSANPSATLTHTPTNNAVTSGNPSATLTHSVTNNTVTSANPSATLTHSVTQPDAHSYTPAGTVTQPTYTGDATSIVQPYIVVFCWKRTA